MKHSLFDTMYSQISQELWHQVMGHRKCVTLARHLATFAQRDRVLEIGTAEGALLRYLKLHGHIRTGVGYDCLPARIKRAKERAMATAMDRDLSFFCGDGWTLPMRDEEFDVVLMPHVLEHVPSMTQMASLLRESMRVSRQGLLVVVPLRDSNERLGRWSKYVDLDHLRGLVQYHNSWVYQSSALTDFLNVLGMRAERSDDCDRYFFVFKDPSRCLALT